MPRIRRIVLGALVSLGVILGIYTSVQGMSLGSGQGSRGSHPVNIYSRSFSDSPSNTLKQYQTQGDQQQNGHGGCHSDSIQVSPDD